MIDSRVNFSFEVLVDNFNVQGLCFEKFVANLMIRSCYVIIF